MIDFLLNILYRFLEFIINLLPAGGGWPVEVHNAFETLGTYTGFIDVFIPLTILLWCVTLIFSVEIAIFGYKTINWIISHIPGLGGADFKD